MIMAKALRRLATVLAACCACAGPALAQARGGVPAAPAPHISVPAPAPHISVPTPHISTPVVPRISTPTPHVVTPHFQATPRVNIAPHVATPHLSPRTPSTWHAPGRGAGRSATRSASHNFAGRDLTRHGNLRQWTARERALARDRLRTGDRFATDHNRIGAPLNRPRAEAPSGSHRLSGAQFAALSRPLGERNRNDHDRRRWFHERRRFHHGGFVGWFGPVFWPYAYDDFFDYAFWPAQYDNYGFWASAYDDVLANAFFSPGTEDIYPSVGAERRGRGGKRRHAREMSPAATDFCRVDPGLARWPVDEIAKVVEPTGEQQTLLDDLKAASARAAKLLQTACPASAPSTPLGRLDAMAKRLDVMLQALDVVRPALAKFYDSLSDEQKARFNGMDREQGGAQGKDEVRLCGTQTPAGLTDEAIDRVEDEVRPNDRQRAELDALRDVTAKAAETLRAACPDRTPITPVARLDAMAKRVTVMLDATNTIRPALARFYDSLSDEQKAHFNVMVRASDQ
jgi:LTXXQ motif family protein